MALCGNLMVEFGTHLDEQRVVDPVLHLAHGTLKNGWFELALPYGDDVPAHVEQLRLALRVAFLVAFQLLPPELGVRPWIDYVVMGMPEAAVHEDTHAVFPHHDIGRAGQPAVILAVTVAVGIEPSAHGHLRPRVLASDPAHVVGPSPLLPFCLFCRHRRHRMECPDLVAKITNSVAFCVDMPTRFCRNFQSFQPDILD